MRAHEYPFSITKRKQSQDGKRTLSCANTQANRAMSSMPFLDSIAMDPQTLSASRVCGRKTRTLVHKIAMRDMSCWISLERVSYFKERDAATTPQRSILIYKKGETAAEGRAYLDKERSACRCSTRSNLLRCLLERIYEPLPPSRSHSASQSVLLFSLRSVAEDARRNILQKEIESAETRPACKVRHDVMTSECGVHPKTAANLIQTLIQTLSAPPSSPLLLSSSPPPPRKTNRATSVRIRTLPA